MNKQELLQNVKNQDEKIFIAKILDKIEFTKTKNKIECTDFLNLYEQEIALSIMRKIGFERFYLFGGKENAERKVLIMYPEKLTEEMAMKNDTNFIKIIQISLPKELGGEFDHRTYLGAIIKLGIEREKIGDILVSRDMADIIVKEEVKDFLMQNLGTLTRFQSANITEKEISEVSNVEIAKLEISSVVSSLRLDNIVSILAKTSRSKATEILEQERVFLNFKVETKSSKQVKVGDVITIRGKGRFEFKEIAGNTRKGRYIVKIDKYV